MSLPRSLTPWPSHRPSSSWTYRRPACRELDCVPGCRRVAGRAVRWSRRPTPHHHPSLHTYRHRNGQFTEINLTYECTVMDWAVDTTGLIITSGTCCGRHIWWQIWHSKLLVSGGPDRRADRMLQVPGNTVLLRHVSQLLQSVAYFFLAYKHCRRFLCHQKRKQVMPLCRHMHTYDVTHTHTHTNALTSQDGSALSSTSQKVYRNTQQIIAGNTLNILLVECSSWRPRPRQNTEEKKIKKILYRILLCESLYSVVFGASED